MPVLLGLVALLAVEVATVALVSSWIGLGWTLLLLLLTSLVGGWLVRREGGRAWRAFSAAVAEGRPPGREALDGVLILLGGLLVLLPGFVSDVLGLLCLLPPTRRLLGRALVAWALSRGRSTVLRVRSTRGAAVPPYPRGPSGEVVIEGEIEAPPPASGVPPDTGTARS
ncbi:MAG TPA: FxsA family protein [Mycobacteriales bacterium]|nr:FxsA family protein [Mycobacteriales bacterium]